MSSRALRLTGLGGCAFGNLILFAFIAAVPAGWCGYALCRGGLAPPAYPGFEPGLFLSITLWAPSVDEANDAEAGACPGPRARAGSIRVQRYSLPSGYDPTAYPSRDVLACVRVGTRGEVRAARLLTGTGSPSIDRRLTDSMTREGAWLFSEPHDREHAWVRVRLSSPPPPVVPVPDTSPVY